MSGQIHAWVFQTEPPVPTEGVAESVWLFGEEKNLLLLPAIEVRIAQAIAVCAIPANVSYRISCFNLFSLLFCFKNTERKQQRFPWTKLRHLLQFKWFRPYAEATLIIR